MKIIRARLVLLVCALLLPSVAAADDPHTDASIGARTVFYRPLDADHGAWAKGAQLKLHVSQSYALQASMDVTHYSLAGANFRAVPVQVSLLGYFTPETPMSFFLLAGMGWYTSRVDGPGSHSETRSNPHVGVGLELVTEKRWTLDASYRFLWSQVYRLSDLGHPYGSGFKERASMLTLALNWRF
jgi:opacity protein-like surface antigen